MLLRDPYIGKQRYQRERQILAEKYIGVSRPGAVFWIPAFAGMTLNIKTGMTMVKRLLRFARNDTQRLIVADLVLDLDIEGVFGEVHAFEKSGKGAGFPEASHGDFLQMF